MKELKFVDVGEGITEGHVRKWLIADGAIVKEDQAIVKIETDKAIVDVPAPASGIVKINAQENTDVHIGDIIAYIGTADELSSLTGAGPAIKLSQQKTSKAVEERQAQSPLLPAQAVTILRGEVLATPSVRKLARDLKVDITSVAGSGPSGRILENDVRNTIGSAQVPVAQRADTAGGHVSGQVDRIPLTQLRKAIARNMEESARIPRAVHIDIADADSLFDAVSTLRKEVEWKSGAKLTFIPFIIKAVVEALKEHPRFNSSYDGQTGEIVLKKYYNIGIAVDSPDGLRVVVIKDADKKDVVGLAIELQKLRKKIADGNIALEDLQGSTFTITNVGSLGGYLSVPMINPPEVAILGTHTIKDTAVVKDGQIKIGKTLPMSLSFDHRVVDGADAARFLGSIIKRLQDPEFLRVEL